MTKPRKPALPPDEARLFRSAVADVKPLARAARIEHPRSLPRPLPLQRLKDDHHVLRDSLSDAHPWDAGIETGEELSYTRGGIGAQTLRRLRRGHWALQGELDLHGLTVDNARAALADFLRLCERRGWRCVRIVHGKGLGSKHREPVLKRKVAVWLMQRDEILAFCQARPADGGGGAVVVLLKSAGR